MSQDYDQQLAAKAAHLSRLMGLPLDGITPSPRPLAYRARVSMRPDAAGRLGYFRPRSHEHVPAEADALARPEISAVLADLPPIPPGLAEVELRSDGERVALSARSAARAGPRKGKGRGGLAREDLAALRIPSVAGVALDGRAVAGDVRMRLAVAGIEHRLAPDTFYQVNLEINAALVARVRERVAALAPARVLDLYAGCGNLSLPLAAAGVGVTLLESSPSAVADAKEAAARHGLTAEIRRGDADKFQAGDAFFDVALLDPPRAGAPGVIPQLLLTRPRAVVYVSCNPPLLARDVRPALAAGYRVAWLELFDMFPQTDHLEALCVLQRP